MKLRLSSGNKLEELSQDSKLAKTNEYSKYNYKEFLRHGIYM